MSELLTFVAGLPDGARAPAKWATAVAELRNAPGAWAKINAKGGYPRQALARLGCEVRIVKGETFARWPAAGAVPGETQRPERTETP